MRAAGRLPTTRLVKRWFHRRVSPAIPLLTSAGSASCYGLLRALLAPSGRAGSVRVIRTNRYLLSVFKFLSDERQCSGFD